MPRSRSAAATREAILRATVQAIGERGFEGVRYADVAGAAGVAVGTVQHHFASREALLGAAFLEENRSAIEAVRALAEEAGDDPWRRLEAIADALVTGGRWGLWLEFWAAARHRPELQAVLDAAYEAWREPARDAIAAGTAAGRFDPRFAPEEIAAAFVAALDGLAIQRELGFGWLEDARAREIVLAALGAALRPAFP